MPHILTRLLALWVAALLSFPAVAQRGVFVYSDPGDRVNDFVIHRGSYVSTGHRVLDTSFCKDGDAFHCFNAEGFRFAVPKRLDPRISMQTWEFDGRRYNATYHTEGMQILGRRLDVFVIDAVDEDPPTRFFFSVQFGLIALKGLGEEYKRTFVIQSACGFGSARSCR